MLGMVRGPDMGSFDFFERGVFGFLQPGNASV
jgi:hypothetical protein